MFLQLTLQRSSSFKDFMKPKVTSPIMPDKEFVLDETVSRPATQSEGPGHGGQGRITWLGFSLFRFGCTVTRVRIKRCGKWMDRSFWLLLLFLVFMKWGFSKWKISLYCYRASIKTGQVVGQTFMFKGHIWIMEEKKVKYVRCYVNKPRFSFFKLCYL